MKTSPLPQSTFRNYLNISDPDTYVYRIVPLNRLYELFNKKENVLVAPKLWDDPFENFVLNSTVVDQNGETFEFGFRSDYYGQCWTTSRASDALWRIYSPDSRSVRIRSTVRALAESLSVHHSKLMNSNCFVGKVQYTSDSDLTKFAQSTATAGPKPEIFAQTLLRKRRAFAHEREIRIIYHDASKSVVSDLYRYSIDPHKLIDQVMLDPRTDHEDCIDIKAAILRRTNFSGSLMRSGLYDPPPNQINL